MKKVLFICLMAMVLTGCITTKDPRGLHGTVLRDMRTNQDYMAMKKANGLYEMCYKTPDGNFIIP